MGIGLAIAHGLAQVIGATITVAAEPTGRPRHEASSIDTRLLARLFL